MSEDTGQPTPQAQIPTWLIGLLVANVGLTGVSGVTSNQAVDDLKSSLVGSIPERQYLEEQAARLARLEEKVESAARRFVDIQSAGLLQAASFGERLTRAEGAARERFDAIDARISSHEESANERILSMGKVVADMATKMHTHAAPGIHAQKHTDHMPWVGRLIEAHNETLLENK